MAIVSTLAFGVLDTIAKNTLIVGRVNVCLVSGHASNSPQWHLALLACLAMMSADRSMAVPDCAVSLLDRALTRGRGVARDT